MPRIINWQLVTPINVAIVLLISTFGMLALKAVMTANQGN